MSPLATSVVLLSLLPASLVVAQGYGLPGDGCESEVDCAEGLSCAEGACSDACSVGGPPCADGYHCNEGECVACLSDGDCLSRAEEALECPSCHYCDEGTCEVGCDDALNPCPASQQCAERRCVDCVADSDCGEGRVCNASRCVQCRDQSNCPEGRFCVLQTCRACRGDRDCADGTLCISGACLDCTAACASGTCSPPECEPIDCSDRQFETIYVDFDESTVRADQEARVMHNAWCMRQFPDENVLIEGHTDERNTDAFNMALGQRQAMAVRRFLERTGIDANRLDIISYGESHPVCRESNEACWRQNRRVEMRWW